MNIGIVTKAKSKDQTIQVLLNHKLPYTIFKTSCTLSGTAGEIKAKLSKVAKSRNHYEYKPLLKILGMHKSINNSLYKTRNKNKSSIKIIINTKILYTNNEIICRFKLSNILYLLKIL